MCCATRRASSQLKERTNQRHARSEQVLFVVLAPTLLDEKHDGSLQDATAAGGKPVQPKHARNIETASLSKQQSMRPGRWQDSSPDRVTYETPVAPPKNVQKHLYTEPGCGRTVTLSFVYHPLPPSPQTKQGSSAKDIDTNKLASWGVNVVDWKLCSKHANISHGRPNADRQIVASFTSGTRPGRLARVCVARIGSSRIGIGSCSPLLQTNVAMDCISSKP